MEIVKLIESMKEVVSKVESVLHEKESITKNEVKKYIDDVL